MTTRINIIDRTTLRILRDEIEDAVKAVADKYDLSITTGRGVYGHTSGRLQLEIAVKGDGGEVLTRERSDFARLDYMIAPLVKGDLDRSFHHLGRIYKVTGLRVNARKNNIETLRDDGKVYVWPATTVKRLLDAERKAEGAA